MTNGTSYSGTPQNNTNATISLIAGILGLTLFPGIGSIIAVILGMMAKKEIRAALAAGNAVGGDGMATAGLIMGWIGIALGVIACCVVGIVFLIPAILIPLGISLDSSWLPLLFTI